MKRIVIIASALAAFASFGGQQNPLDQAITNSMQQYDAIDRYWLELHRAIANRIMREQHDREERLRLEIEMAERANTNNQAGAEASERNRKASEQPGKNPINRRQTPAEAKQKKED